MPTSEGDRQDDLKYSRIKGERREAKRQRARRAKAGQLSGHSGKGRNISVRGDFRDSPDVQRMARIMIRLGLAEAERQAAAQAEQKNHEEAS